MHKLRPLAFVGMLSAFAWLSAAALSASQAADAAAKRLVLNGYDPVAYFTKGKALPGHLDYQLVFDGMTFRFINDRHRDLFVGNPDKYIPQFAGSCAVAMVRGVEVATDPRLWKIHGGKLYVFATIRARESFEQDPDITVARAHANWDRPTAPQPTGH